MQFNKKPQTPEFVRWASMGPAYSEYGTWLILNYPFHYINHFIWPNANKFFATPLEFLEVYNSGKDTITDIAQSWFGFKSRTINTNFKDNKTAVLNVYPILSGIISSLVLMSICCFALYHRSLKSEFRLGIMLAFSLWITNAFFTILASSAALRFQAFPIILSLFFLVLLIDALIKMGL